MTITRTPAEAVVPVKPAPLSSYARAYWGRVRAGEIGSLPGVLGIVLLVAGFGIVKPVFLTPNNFVNLLVQSAVFIVSAMGIVFVLLIGEIDLSAGWTAGVCAAVMATMLVDRQFPWYVAILAAIATGTVIGMLLGILVTKLGVPSFVVTLAAFLAFQGVLLWLVNEGQVILITDKTVLAISNNNLPVWLGLTFIAVAVVGFAAVQILRNVRRKRRGVSYDPTSLVALRIGAIVAIAGFGAYLLSINRAPNRNGYITGVPIVLPIVVVLLVVLTFVLKRTRFGLYLYAVGGNAEAARRAGINVNRVYVSVFALCSTFAALGGVLAAARLQSVSQTSGGTDTNLMAIAAAVIGGTSLFGGRGSVYSALFGMLVLQSITSGLNLIGVDAYVRYMVTGGVLVLAVTIDSLSRQARKSSGSG